DKYPAIVAKLARAPGTKEPRYAHLLSGEEALEQQEVAAAFSSNIHATPQRDRLAHLEDEVVQLRAQLDALSLQFQEFQKQFE
ncbi:MAG: DUF480 domain-containing protein, partial [Pseudomonadota bacterium]